jgi:hypothetical protein
MEATMTKLGAEAFERARRFIKGGAITPLKVAPRPESAVADLLADVVPVQLAHLIERQAAAGNWEPVWNWGDGCAAAWERARREWRGELTLNALKTLRAYGRLTPGTGARRGSAG